MKLVIFWFRRDLRVEDNHGLYRALTSGMPVLPLFIFDREILERLGDKDDARVAFIHGEVKRIKTQLEKAGSSLLIRFGKPVEVFGEIMEKLPIADVYANHDYEPYARERDQSVKQLLESRGARLITFKDQVVFEKSEVAKDNGSPYTVFTPYSRRWKAMFLASPPASYPSQLHLGNLHEIAPFPMIELGQMGFNEGPMHFPSRKVDRELMAGYDRTRDFPGSEGTSRLGVHLRFGTISIRELALTASELNQVYLNELIWREFYMMILWHFPHIAGSSFKPEYERIAWSNDEELFHAWCVGRTGYPIVDAGMRQLNRTGYMHNRARMITASFLTKHLLTDWRWGEAYFAKKLLDYELSSNNGGWQWAAGTGCDAAPYFRVFNPDLQAAKFDREKKYILEWVPEYGSDRYVQRIVDHQEARIKAISVYKKAFSVKG